MGELLQALFAGKEADDCILIWRLETKRSQWFNDPNIVPHSQIKGNIYFGVGTVSGPDAEAAGNFKRSSNTTISGIGALWLDVDIAGPAHKKGNLPNSPEVAMSLVRTAFPIIEPSFIIDSGHGLQLYWLLDHWHKITDVNRAETSALLLDFNTRWRNVCKANDLDADSVCDLARVMRLPGTINNKVPEDPRLVTEIKADASIRYSFGHLRRTIPKTQTTKGQTPCPSNTREPKSRTSKPNSAAAKSALTELDTNKWEALCENEPRALQSFEHSRPDIADQSPSAYDMSLMAFAVRAGWSDDEAITLALACRAHHGQEIKERALRFTLRKVHDEVDALSGINDTREEKLDKLCAALGFDIHAITRYDSTPPAYVITTTDEAKIHLGLIDGLTDPRKFRNTIAATVGILPTKTKPDLWDLCVQRMLDCLDHDSAGAEATDDGQMREWLAAYLNDQEVHVAATDDEARDAGLTSGGAWVESGAVHICGTPLRSWLTIHLGERIDSRRLGLMLRAIGSEPCTVALRADGETRRRAAWKISRKIWEPK